ncbi:MAG: Uma2 family endonuclease [Bacteroidota bacterium]
MEVATIDRSREWTVNDYLKLEEGLLAQLIDGSLIMSPAPSINHQRVIGKLFKILDGLSSGEAILSPVDLYLNNQNVLQPDLVFISNEKKAIITDRGIEGVPDLIVEVISPSNSFIDRNTKKRKYLQFGVTEYWIIDPANKTLEVYTPEDEDQPRLYLVNEGDISSLISEALSFDLKEIL